MPGVTDRVVLARGCGGAGGMGFATARLPRAAGARVGRVRQADRARLQLIVRPRRQSGPDLLTLLMRLSGHSQTCVRGTPGDIGMRQRRPGLRRQSATPSTIWWAPESSTRGSRWSLIVCSLNHLLVATGTKRPTGSTGKRIG